MNPAPHIEETQRKIAVMQAHAEGKPVQFKRRIDDETHWQDQPDPWWAWQLYDYRVAPVPVEAVGDAPLETFWRTEREGFFDWFRELQGAKDHLLYRSGKIERFVVWPEGWTAPQQQQPQGREWRIAVLREGDTGRIAGPIKPGHSPHPEVWEVVTVREVNREGGAG